MSALIIHFSCWNFFWNAEYAFGEAFSVSQVRAVFLYNITKFVTWPPKMVSSKGTHGKFSIGILGVNPYANHLKTVIGEETIFGRSVEVVFFKESDRIDWERLHILYVDLSSIVDLATIKEQARSNSVLTVGGEAGFCESGGMVSFLTVERKMKIVVNLEELTAADLKISSHVLKLAQVVQTGESGKGK